MISTFFPVAVFALCVQSFVLPNVEQIALRFLDGNAEEAPQQEKTCSETIAIIGSGITGAVAAFNLYEGFRQRILPNRWPCITVFERNAIVGGRITETFAFGDPAIPIDTCAATFSIGDTCLANAAGEVGLTPIVEQVLRPTAGVGVWDGKRIVNLVDASGFRNPFGWSYFKNMEWLPLYERFPPAFENLVNGIRVKFDTLLPSLTPIQRIPGEPVRRVPGERNLSEIVHRSKLEKLVQSPFCDEQAFDFLNNDGDYRFYREAILPGVRERFFTNGLNFNLLELYLGFEEALEVLVEGGNLRLIERLLKISGASIRLNTEVREVRRFDRDFRPTSSLLTIAPTSGGESTAEQFDAVIVATSLERGNISFSPPLPDSSGFRQEYEDSVVTHFTTSSRLNPAFFDWKGTMPQNILTTEICNETTTDCIPPFFSLTFLREVLSPYNGYVPENLYKIVSREVITDETIQQYLLPIENPFGRVISWIDREILPKSVPVETSDKEGEDCKALLEDIEIAPLVFYAGGGEQIVASAEFGCRMGKNAADLILDLNNEDG